MKKIGLFVLGITISSSAIFAQSLPQFGIKGGINISNLNSNEGTQTSARTGFHVGVLANVPLGSGFSIQPEGVYSSQGFKYVENEGRYAGEHSVAVNYI